MFDIPLSEISKIHFKPYELVSFIKVITKSNTIRMWNIYQYPIEDILSSLEIHMRPYEQLIINKNDLQFVLFKEIKYYVESKLWKRKPQLYVPYTFEVKNTKTNEVSILDTNIVFKTHRVDDNDYLMYKSLCVNWNNMNNNQI